jgi:hypothetical protein
MRSVAAVDCGIRHADAPGSLEIDEQFDFGACLQQWLQAGIFAGLDLE